jgi:hypothetical protein
MSMVAHWRSLFRNSDTAIVCLNPTRCRNLFLVSVADFVLCVTSFTDLHIPKPRHNTCLWNRKEGEKASCMF